MAEDDNAERRRAPRERAFLGVEIRRGEKLLAAVIRDCSETGLQLLMARRVEIGDRLEATVFVGEDETAEVEGEVVRAQKLDTFDGPWRWRVGIAFDTPRPELAELAAERGREQEKIYGK